MKTPDITPAQVVAVVLTVVGLFVTQGLVSNGTGKLIGGLASVLIPLGWMVADAFIRHGRSRALAPLQNDRLLPGPVPVPRKRTRKPAA